MPIFYIGEEIFSAEPGGTLQRRRRADDFPHENNARNARLCLNNGNMKLKSYLLIYLMIATITNKLAKTLLKILYWFEMREITGAYATNILPRPRSIVDATPMS